jgi:hypothetical protein
LNEGEGIKGDLINELHALMIGCMINATLQDAASVSVSGNFDTVGGNGIVDELQVGQQRSQACGIMPYLIVIRS